MPRAVTVILIVGAALYAFFDILSTDKSRFRSLAKGAWLMLALVPIVGAVLWFTVGRGQRKASANPRSIQLPNSRRRPVAPDDDPAFLRKLEEEAWRAKRKKKDQESPSGAAGAAGGSAAEGAKPGATPSPDDTEPTEQAAEQPAPASPESDPGVGVQPAEEQVDPEVVEDERQQPE